MKGRDYIVLGLVSIGALCMFGALGISIYLQYFKYGDIITAQLTPRQQLAMSWPVWVLFGMGAMFLVLGKIVDMFTD
jgi:hypothetical protein